MNLAELEAMNYNDTKANAVFIQPINLFITEQGVTLIDTFNTLVIMNLDEKFLDSKLGVSIHNVSLKEAWIMSKHMGR